MPSFVPSLHIPPGNPSNKHKPYCLLTLWLNTSHFLGSICSTVLGKLLYSICSTVQRNLFYGNCVKVLLQSFYSTTTLLTVL